MGTNDEKSGVFDELKTEKPVKQEMLITYRREGDMKTLNAVFEGRDTKCEIDEFVLETVMKN